MKASLIISALLLTVTIAETHAKGFRGGGFRSSSFRSHSVRPATPKPAPVVRRPAQTQESSSGSGWLIPAAAGYMIGTSGNSHAAPAHPVTPTTVKIH